MFDFEYRDYSPSNLSMLSIPNISASQQDSNYEDGDNSLVHQSLSQHHEFNQLYPEFEQQVNQEKKEDYIEQERITNIGDFKSVLEEINCMICFHLVQEAVCCALCEAVYCRNCIHEWFKQSPFKQVCPCCRTDSSDYFNKHPFSMLNTGMIEFFKNKPSIITSKVPQILKKVLSKIQLRCKHYEEGCNEILFYESLHKHESYLCDYTIVSCRFMGCDEVMRKIDMSEHEQLCPYAKVKCRYCDKMIQRQNYDLHQDICDYRLQSCKWCHDKQYVCEIDDHQELCTLRIIDCEICFDSFFLDKFKLHTPEVCWRLKFQRSSQNEIKLQKKLERLEEELRMVKSENKQLKQENQLLLENTNHQYYEEEKKQDDIIQKNNDGYSFTFEEYDEQEEPIEEIIEFQDDSFLYDNKFNVMEKDHEQDETETKVTRASFDSINLRSFQQQQSSIDDIFLSQTEKVKKQKRNHDSPSNRLPKQLEDLIADEEILKLLRGFAKR